MNDQLIKDFIEKYFNQALKSFLEYQQHLEEQFSPCSWVALYVFSCGLLDKSNLSAICHRLWSTRRHSEPNSKPNHTTGPPGTRQRQKVLEINDTISEAPPSQPQVAPIKLCDCTIFC
jgi:hypothetical protein